MADRKHWNDALIEEEVRKLTSSLGHFPTVQDMKDLNRGDLANALNKRGGILHWSDKLGISRVHSDSDTGWAGEIAVRKILENRGFSVSCREGVKSPYDLIANGRVRIDVKTAKQTCYAKFPAWFYRIGKSVQSDVVILFQADTGICYVLPWWEVGTTNITISPTSPKYDRFKNRFDIISDYGAAVGTLSF